MSFYNVILQCKTQCQTLCKTLCQTQCKAQCQRLCQTYVCKLNFIFTKLISYLKKEINLS